MNVSFSSSLDRIFDSLPSSEPEEPWSIQWKGDRFCVEESSFSAPLALSTEDSLMEGFSCLMLPFKFLFSRRVQNPGYLPLEQLPSQEDQELQWRTERYEVLNFIRKEWGSSIADWYYFKCAEEGMAPSSPSQPWSYNEVASLKESLQNVVAFREWLQFEGHEFYTSMFAEGRDLEIPSINKEHLPALLIQARDKVEGNLHVNKEPIPSPENLQDRFTEIMDIAFENIKKLHGFLDRGGEAAYFQTLGSFTQENRGEKELTSLLMKAKEAAEVHPRFLEEKLEEQDIRKIYQEVVIRELVISSLREDKEEASLISPDLSSHHRAPTTILKKGSSGVDNSEEPEWEDLMEEEVPGDYTIQFLSKSDDENQLRDCIEKKLMEGIEQKEVQIRTSLNFSKIVQLWRNNQADLPLEDSFEIQFSKELEEASSSKPLIKLWQLSMLKRMGIMSQALLRACQSTRSIMETILRVLQESPSTLKQHAFFLESTIRNFVFLEKRFFLIHGIHSLYAPREIPPVVDHFQKDLQAVREQALGQINQSVQAILAKLEKPPASLEDSFKRMQLKLQLWDNQHEDKPLAPQWQAFQTWYQNKKKVEQPVQDILDSMNKLSHQLNRSIEDWIEEHTYSEDGSSASNT